MLIGLEPWAAAPPPKNLLQPRASAGWLLELLGSRGVQNIEASSYISVTAALVKFRVQGLRRDSGGRVVPARRILLKASRPEIAEA
ncbi:hypothetical protein [Paenibacillus sp. S150]|uniref:hypothetical protein n=1 Tax=Paenibacillus sp. S150 TaxID=2749826 RepID=UPI001C55C480|nr:hypothetical protein [Paenibacillus sp. S150]MBW4080623.1 hypothetical protein [Paenibacillus sp. S150]